MPSASTSEASRSTDVEVAIAAASAGAEVLRGSHGAALTRFAKAGIDFATEADIEAEQAIRAVIAAARPDDAFLGEEGGLAGGPDATRTWLVDPLCGTLNFAARTPLACANVALRGDGGVAVAAIADPFTTEILWTDGRTAWARDTDDVPLTPTAASRLVDVDFDGRPEWSASLVSGAGFASRFGTRVSSTTLALAWVATGQRAGYVHAGDTRDSVHFAAGIALCRAAGCVVSSLDGGPIGTSADGLLAAADADTHEALLAEVARVPR